MLKLNVLNAGQVLGRSEMKKIMAGSGCSGNECTNCIICPSGHHCEVYEWPNPWRPGPGCSWGHCSGC